MSMNVFANTITLSIKDMPVREVVSMLTAQSGVNIIVSSDADMDKKISINLTNYELEKALKYIAMASGLSYRLEEGTYIFGGSASSSSSLISPETLIGSVAAVPSVSETENTVVAVPSPIETAVIKLVCSDARELLKTIGWQDTGGAYGVSQSHNEAYKKLREERTANPKSYNPRVKYSDNGQPMTPSISPVNNFTDAGRFGDASEAAAQMGGFGGGGGSRGGMQGGGGMSGGGMQGGGGMSGGMGGMSGGMGGSGGSSGGWSNMLMPQNLMVMPFDLDNSILVKGTAADIAEMRKLIQDLDIPPKQVEIKAEFIEISTGDVKKFGIDWQLGKIGRQFGTGTTDSPFSPGGNVFFNYANGNLVANLQAQLTETVGKVVNSPIVSTINNYPASISIEQEIPYFTYTNTVDNGTVLSTYEVDTVDVSSYLDVTPRINADDTITLYVDTQTDEVVEYVTDPEGQKIPVTMTQSLISIRRIYNGDTVVIGGFVRTHNTSSVNKIPLLADLPIIGALFKTYDNSKDERELLIFITPRIIRDSANMNKAGLTEI